jgi:hypothetical protein
MLVVWRFGTIATGLAGLLACEDPGTTPGTDAGVAPRCSATAAFARPTRLMSLNTLTSNDQATLSADELTVYFSRNDVTGNFDIYQATRASTTAAFGAASPVAGVNTAADERGPHVTADGLTLYATSQLNDTSQYRVTFATRTTTADSFGPLQNVPVINGTRNDSDPFISADGSVLYFSSDRTAIAGYALFRSVQTGGTFSAPELVMGTNLDTTSGEITPVLSVDELTLYFGSLRQGRGSADIFQATRATAQDPFGEPIPLNELNTQGFEVPSWISADGCELYITRLTTANTLELAVALRGK